ncbi:MAG: hypothetical protein H6667_22085 [Ardenticatenaceae bacterium]|nr:hypothetical protein [Ardenticatenaceae bacterium]
MEQGRSGLYLASGHDKAGAKSPPAALRRLTMSNEAISHVPKSSSATCAAASGQRCINCPADGQFFRHFRDTQEAD